MLTKNICSGCNQSRFNLSSLSVLNFANFTDFNIVMFKNNLSLNTKIHY